jgi:hypothetical protein
VKAKKDHEQPVRNPANPSRRERPGGANDWLAYCQAAGPSNCPVVLDAYIANELAGGLLQVMRRLRRDLKRCSTCSLNCASGESPGCPLAAYLNSMIHQSLEEIYMEWDQAAMAQTQE